mmetsp:Transcript_29349/g.47132  ORF Transcript_29349/g.47132 Transcript_29349/m.47132 type:complete len:201 (-) Transcript_29349:392-994(-)
MRACPAGLGVVCAAAGGRMSHVCVCVRACVTTLNFNKNVARPLEFSMSAAPALRSRLCLGRRGDEGTPYHLDALHRVQQLPRRRPHDDDLPGTRSDETAFHRLVEEGEKQVEVAPHVEASDGLRMVPELLPRHHLQQLLQRAEASGHRDEGVRLFRHPGLSLVHVLHHHHFADRLARQLDGLERNRDDAENVSTLIEYLA